VHRHTTTKSPLSTRIRSIAKRHKGAVIAHHVVDDWLFAWRERRGVAPSTSGSSHRAMTTAESLRYIDGIFASYLSYGSMSASALSGKRVLEIGPGDNLGVALRFLEAGAAQVVCLDRFASVKDDAAERAVYASLLASTAGEGRERLKRVIDDDGRFKPGQQQLVSLVGSPAERCDALFPQGSFDLAISWTVLQHVQDPRRVLQALDNVLRPGGRMIHIIDLYDMGMFSSGGMHPLTFLTIPSGLYRRMSAHSGLPNRWRMQSYLDVWAALGYSVHAVVTEVLGIGRTAVAPSEVSTLEGFSRSRRLISEVRSRLDTPFQGLADEDLAVEDFWAFCEKPLAEG
jgi:SAM-dependent methyltransferase